jgi:hypothetical protein
MDNFHQTKRGKKILSEYTSPSEKGKKQHAGDHTFLVFSIDFIKKGKFKLLHFLFQNYYHHFSSFKLN